MGSLGLGLGAWGCLGFRDLHSGLGFRFGSLWV